MQQGGQTLNGALSMRVPLKDLTREHVLQAKAVCVDLGSGVAVIARDYRKLPPMMASDVPAPLSPEDLIVEVPQGVGPPLAAVQAALRYMGLGFDHSDRSVGPPVLVYLN